MDEKMFVEKVVAMLVSKVNSFSQAIKSLMIRNKILDREVNDLDKLINETRAEVD